MSEVSINDVLDRRHRQLDSLLDRQMRAELAVFEAEEMLDIAEDTALISGEIGGSNERLRKAQLRDMTKAEQQKVYDAKCEKIRADYLVLRCQNQIVRLGRLADAGIETVRLTEQEA